jgi:exonuclease VII large subunit
MSMGYAALLRDGRPVNSVKGLKSGDSLTARFADGSADMTVNGVRKDGNTV